MSIDREKKQNSRRDKYGLRNRMPEETSTDWKTETECRKKKIRIEKKRM